MLSNFIFDNVLTRNLSGHYSPELLWFAFKFYLWQRSYKCRNCYQTVARVVICFQILSLTTFLQEIETIVVNEACCDLLSNFIFDNVLTSYQFQKENRSGCDLLSNFIFDNVLTSVVIEGCIIEGLWFAFKFYLWQRSYKHRFLSLTLDSVVICFQILSLTTFLQEFIGHIIIQSSCDLLSNFIFDNVLTSFPVKDVMSQQFMFCLRF